MELGESEALCIQLQGRVKEMEQHEIGQMRQAAILQRKVEEAEKGLRELTHQLRAEQESLQEGAEKQLKEQLDAKTSSKEEKRRAVEKEFEDLLRQEKNQSVSIEQSLREARNAREKVRGSLTLWKDRAQRLLQKPDEGLEKLKDSQQVQSTLLREECNVLQNQRKQAQDTCTSLEQQLVDVRKIADSARQEDDALRLRAESLEESLGRVQASLKESQERQQAEEKLAQAANGDLQSLEAAYKQKMQWAQQSEISTGNEQISFLRRKATEKKAEVERLQCDKASLLKALQRHRAVGGADSRDVERISLVHSRAGMLDAIDKPLADITTILFKSIFVRRVFCVHLVVLYTWVLFLICYLILRGEENHVAHAHHEMHQGGIISFTLHPNITLLPNPAS